MAFRISFDLLIFECFHLFISQYMHELGDSTVEHKLHLHIFIRSDFKEINVT